MRIFIGSRIVVRTSQGELQGTVIETRPGGARVLFQNGSSDWVREEQIVREKAARPARPQPSIDSAGRGDSSGEEPKASRVSDSTGEVVPHSAPLPVTENRYAAPSEEAQSAPGRRGFAHLFFSFEGRISRSEYWLALGLLMIVPFLVVVASGVLIAHKNGPARNDPEAFGWVLAMSVVCSAAAIGVLSIAPTAKRWHDRNRTAWVMLFSLIPFVGGLWSLWSLIELGFLPGTRGRNRFGPDPLNQQR